jgi:hypothetical protein
MKGVVSPVTGKADILVVPDLEDGSMLVKQLLFLADAQSCGILPFGGSRSKQGLQRFPTFSLFFISLFFFFISRNLKGRDPNPNKASREIGYCHLEKLHNLESLPADGFAVVCFPVKIRAASAGWTRAVAIVEDGK